MIMEDQIYTLSEARKLLPRVRRITRRYFYQVERLKEVFKATNDWDELQIIKGEVDLLISQWFDQLNRIHVEVKGLWLAGFDSGDGIYYLWHFDDPDLSFYCTYERPNDHIPIHVWNQEFKHDTSV